MREHGDNVHGLDSTKKCQAIGGPVPVWREVVTACRWPVVVLMGVLSLGRFVGAGQKEDETLRAKKIVAENFEIPGADGKPVAMFYRTGDGQGRLAFLNKKGELRLTVGMNPDGAPGIILLGNDQKQRLNMTVLPDGDRPVLNLFDDNGKSLIGLAVMEGSGAQVSIGRRDKGRITISLSKEGDPGVWLWAKNDEPRIGLELVDGAPLLRFFDGNKAARITWKLRADGSPSFSIADERSRDRLSIGTGQDGQPYIRITDPDRKTSKDL